ncbi:MAG: hypothetical protein ACLSUM_00685 [Dysosmobacter welbionis]
MISSINSASPFRVLLCGHIDEIGFRVTHITDDGYPGGQGRRHPSGTGSG